MAAISRSRNSGSGHTEVDTQKIGESPGYIVYILSVTIEMVRVNVTKGYVSDHGGRKRVGPRPNAAQRAQIRLADRAERERYRRAAGYVITMAMMRHKLKKNQAKLAGLQLQIRRRDAAVKIQRVVRKRRKLLRTGDWYEPIEV